MEKHENYSRLLEDDGEFEAQEGWMGKCQENFMSMEMGAKIYFDSFLSKGKTPLKTYDTSAASKAGVAKGPSKTLGLAKFSPNFMGLAVSFFSGYVCLAVLIFLTKLAHSFLKTF